MRFAALDSSLISAPFVLYPSRIEILGLFAVNYHNLRGLDSIVNIRFKASASHLFYRFGAEKYVISNFGKLVINVSCAFAVFCFLTVIGSLKANENVIGTFAFYNFEKVGSDFFNIACLRRVYFTNFSWRKLNSLLNVL